MLPLTNVLSNAIRQPFGLDLADVPPPPEPEPDEAQGSSIQAVAMAQRDRAARAEARARQAEEALRFQQNIANLAAIIVLVAVLFFLAKKLLDWFRG